MDRANEVVRRSQTGSEELQGAEWQMKSLEIRVNEKGTALEVVLSDPDEVLESQVWELSLSTRSESGLDDQLRASRR